MTDDAHLSDADLESLFDDELGGLLPPKPVDPAQEDPSDAEGDDKKSQEVSLIEAVVEAIKQAKPSEPKQFDSAVLPLLDKIAASDELTQLLVTTLTQAEHPAPAVTRALGSLVFRRSTLYKEHKKVDYRDLNTQVATFLRGQLAWDKIVPKEFVEPKPVPKPPTDPDLTEAGELAAYLKCSYVDVLSLAGLKTGNGKTLVSIAKVAAALELLATPTTKPAKADTKKPFDHEEPGNEPGDGAKPPAKAKPPVAVPKPDDSLNVDNSPPVTGLEYITVDPDDDLSSLDDDWYVKSCQSIVELLGS